MGHYLSDFETPEEHEHRVVFQPMLARLRTYDQEVARGLVHSHIWRVNREADRRLLQSKGYDV